VCATPDSDVASETTSEPGKRPSPPDDISRRSEERSRLVPETTEADCSGAVGEVGLSVEQAAIDSPTRPNSEYDYHVRAIRDKR